MFEPTPNLPLLRKVLEHVDAHPDEWTQYTWGVQTTRSSCGTAFCIAGHAATLAGMEPVWKTSGDYVAMDSVMDGDGNTSYVGDAAQRLLGLTPTEGQELFDGGNTRADIQAVAERIAARGGERL